MVMIMTEAGLVLALDTSTVVNVGLARGDRLLGDGDRRGSDGSCRTTHALGLGMSRCSWRSARMILTN